MYYLLDKKSDQTLTINFIGTEQFNVDDKLTLVSEPIKGITSITSYTDTTVGETSSAYLKKYFQYRREGQTEWSELYTIDKITEIPQYDKTCLLKPFEYRLLYFRMDDGGTQPNVITLSNISIGGGFEYMTSDSQLTITSNERSQIFEISDVLKIFRIDNYEVISSTTPGISYDVSYRFSQDNKRTWSEWERLTLNNLKTARIDKIRFVNLQYLFELKPGINSSVKIYDVIIYGDIQNVSADYLKLNKFGLKENCINLYNKSASITPETSGINNLISANGADSTTQSLIQISSDYQLHMNFLTQGLSCYLSAGNVGGQTAIESLTAQNTANSNILWNPYEMNKTVDFYNFLAGTINSMLGFQIDYHRTDPDGKGIDKIMYEFQLYNIVDMKQLKVLVPENNFPDNQVVVNQFNLDLFDTFKICILKDEFKNAFGVQFRPGKEDILYFCQTNRMYIVKHAQVHKDIMNAGIYYDVVLEKYEKRSNVLNRMEESKNKIQSLTANTTIEELFGIDNKEQQLQISNKIQEKPKSFDFIRKTINPSLKYNRTIIFNGSNKVMESNYILSDVLPTDDAVVYNNEDNTMISSDNRLFSFWFKIPNQYDPEGAVTKRVIDSYPISTKVMYNFIDNITSDQLGYKIWYQNGKIWFMINEKIFTFDASVLSNVWYVLLINFNQRQGEISFKIYRRNTTLELLLINPKSYEKLQLNVDTESTTIEYEISINGFKPIDTIEIENIQDDSFFIEMQSSKQQFSDTYEFTHTETLKIKGSNLHLSNIRIMDNLIKEGEEQYFLNELIVRDAQYMILGDNCEKEIKTTNYTNKNWR